MAPGTKNQAISAILGFLKEALPGKSEIKVPFHRVEKKEVQDMPMRSMATI